MMTDRPDVTFRSLRADDIPALARWLADPDVAPWYDEGTTDPDGLAAHYEPMLRGEEPTHGFTIVLAGEAVGYIQAYVIDDHPDYARQIAVEPGAVGIDLFIGEPSARNRGHGATVLRAFLRDIVFGAMAASVAIIAPSPANTRAIRSYERAGFTWVKTVYIEDEAPGNTGDEYVMRLTRAAFLAANP